MTSFFFVEFFILILFCFARIYNTFDCIPSMNVYCVCVWVCMWMRHWKNVTTAEKNNFPKFQYKNLIWFLEISTLPFAHYYGRAQNSQFFFPCFLFPSVLIIFFFLVVVAAAGFFFFRSSHTESINTHTIYMCYIHTCFA